MKIITDEHCAGYAQPGHPERPERITMTLEKLRAQKELSITWSAPAKADEAAILRAHSPQHLARLTESRDFDGDTPFFPRIADYAPPSVGAALEALQAPRPAASAFHLTRHPPPPPT